MTENNSLWQVIKRKSPPKPIWKIVLRHKAAFENYLGLANAMQEEWVNGHLYKSSERNNEALEVEQEKEHK